MLHCRNQISSAQHAPARVPWSISILAASGIRHGSDTGPACVRHLIRRMSDIYGCGMKGKSPLPADAFATIGQAIGRGGGRRSPLYLWFQEHHDELAAGFARNAPAWQPLADFLGKQGVLDVDGKPPTARAVRDAWWRVRRDLKRAEADRPPPQVPPQPDSMPSGVRPVVQPPPLPSLARPPAVLQPLADTRPRMPPLKSRKTT